ncbi:ABC transporter family protein [Burkholderia cepacia]|nr:ABC transporter family protein [Burkholderia cepacia]
MAQYVFTMNRVGKIVPPKRQILKDISLSFFPGAKIGVLGLNGSGKSTLIRIMAGVDKDIEGEATPMPNLNIGYLPQEPQLDPTKTVREAVEEGLGDLFQANKKLEEIYAAYAEPDADFDALAAEQAKYEAILASSDGGSPEQQLEVAADALRLPSWDAKIEHLSGVRSAASRCASCCSKSPTCCCSTNRPTTSTRNRSTGSSSSWCASRAPSSRSPTIATSSTTRPNGFSNSTAATAFRGRATTAAGSTRRKSG